MITEERLKELIEQKSTIYGINRNKSQSYPKHFNKMRNTNLISKDKLELYKTYYETKEEAEFVAKYHCSKTIKFEPVPFESICNNKHVNYNGIYDCWWNNLFKLRIEIVLHIFSKKANFVVNGKYFEKVDFENKESLKQAYYQAVEYAKKLFLGEE